MAHTPLATISSILVPVDGTAACHQALALAADIAKRAKARIHLLYVIEVPRTIALDATLEGELQRAEQALGQAERVAEGHGVNVTGELVQARQAGHAIVDEAVERGVDVVILGIGYNQPYGRFELGREAQYVLEHASAQVWLIRAQEPSAH
jgi:nucleotide-binding universal stress UspA family protein